MNFRNIFFQFGLLLLVLSAFLLLIFLWGLVRGALHYPVDSAAVRALAVSGVISGAAGLALLVLLRRHDPHIGRREALLLVALSWIGGAASGAMPYFLWAHFGGLDGPHPFHHFVDCYFEAMSGFTTTGSTVLGDIEAIPKSLLLWRSLTQWLGGIGIVVLFVAVLPTLGVGGKKLFRVEAPGPSPKGLQPSIRETTRVLVGIYLLLTITQILLLWISGLSLYDAVTHTLCTLATGGFSPHGASIGQFQSNPAAQWIIIVFMLFAGVNFGLFFEAFRKRFHNIWQDTELRFYLVLLAIASVMVIGVVHYGMDEITLADGQSVSTTWSESIRHGVFQAVSIHTTTGFATADFNLWPFLPKGVLILIMFIGGSAGSTAGGIKVIRIWIALKVMLSEIERVFRPNVVRPVRLGKTTVDPDLKLGTVAYVLQIVLLFVLGSAILMVLETGNPKCDYVTAATATVATLCNIGPGLAHVGAVENFGWFSSPSKLVMAVLMALGRLEVFAIIVLFSPRFWRGD